MNSIQPNIDWTIDNVLKRSYEEVPQEVDDYSSLLEKYEFRNLVVFELYENYFLPQRHEFELQILNDIVEAVVKYQPWSYPVGAAASGVIGSTVYDLLKYLLSYVSAKFKDKDVRTRLLHILTENRMKPRENFQVGSTVHFYFIFYFSFL